MHKKHSILENCLNFSIQSRQPRQIRYFQSPAHKENYHFNNNTPKYHPLSSSKKKYESEVKGNYTIKPITLKVKNLNKRNDNQQKKKKQQKMTKAQHITIKSQDIRKASITITENMSHFLENSRNDASFHSSLFEQLVTFFKKTLKKYHINQTQIQQIINSSYFVNQLKFISQIYMNSNNKQPNIDKICVQCTNQVKSKLYQQNFYNKSLVQKNQKIQSQVYKLRQQVKSLFFLLKKNQQQLIKAQQDKAYYMQNFKAIKTQNIQILQRIQEMKYNQSLLSSKFLTSMNELTELLEEKINENQDEKNFRRILQQQIQKILFQLHKKDDEIKKWKQRYRQIAQFVDKQAPITLYKVNNQPQNQPNKIENLQSSQKISQLIQSRNIHC